MESAPDYEPKADAYEAPEGVLKVAIRTIADDELESLNEASRRAPKQVH
jgi:hypothetical protein